MIGWDVISNHYKADIERRLAEENEKQRCAELIETESARVWSGVVEALPQGVKTINQKLSRDLLHLAVAGDRVELTYVAPGGNRSSSIRYARGAHQIDTVDRQWLLAVKNEKVVIQDGQITFTPTEFAEKVLIDLCG